MGKQPPRSSVRAGTAVRSTEDTDLPALRSLPRWPCRELELRFAVSEVPAVVVLKPSGEVIVGNAVEEIQRLGPACFQNWQEAAELVDQNFLLAEDFDERSKRSLTDPLRRLKYKLDKKAAAKNKDGEEEEGEASP